VFRIVLLQTLKTPCPCYDLCSLMSFSRSDLSGIELLNGLSKKLAKKIRMRLYMAYS